MAIAKITVEIYKTYLPVLIGYLNDAEIEVYDVIRIENSGWYEVKIDYVSYLLDVLKKFFDGLELQVALDNTL